MRMPKLQCPNCDKPDWMIGRRFTSKFIVWQIWCYKCQFHYELSRHLNDELNQWNYAMDELRKFDELRHSSF